MWFHTHTRSRRKGSPHPTEMSAGVNLTAKRKKRALRIWCCGLSRSSSCWSTSCWRVNAHSQRSRRAHSASTVRNHACRASPSHPFALSHCISFQRLPHLTPICVGVAVLEHWNADNAMPTKLDAYCDEVASSIKWQQSYETMTGRAIDKAKEHSDALLSLQGYRRWFEAAASCRPATPRLRAPHFADPRGTTPRLPIVFSRCGCVPAYMTKCTRTSTCESLTERAFAVGHVLRCITLARVREYVSFRALGETPAHRGCG